MAVKVRGIPDHLSLKTALAVAILSVCAGPRVMYGQTVETPQQTNAKIQELASRARTQPTDTPVGAGDLLHIDVFDVPELSRDVRISQTGDVTFPLIPGRIHVEGLTAFQLEEKFAQLLLENGLVSHPQVSVFVKEQTSQPISLVGAIVHPMVYQVVRPTTLIELLADAGGIADDAGPNVVITRSAPHDQGMTPDNGATPAPGSEPGASNSDPPLDPPPTDSQIITIRLQDLLESGDNRYDVPVHGGDVIRVPKAGIIYVLGNGISAPGGYVLQGHGDQVTVLKVVALAHGLTSYAKADSSVILRTDPATGKRNAIPVRVKEIEKHKADDVAVKSNDILYIPDSVGKKALARGGEAAIGIGTGVALYRVAYQ